MKTKMKRNSVGMVVLLAALVFSSFVNKSSMPVININDREENEYSKVWDFTRKTICEPIRVGLPKKEKATKSFSRCPSGYGPEFITKEDEMKTGNFVYGEVQMHNGCTPEYICDFKVCVDKGYAMVKSKNRKEYVPVSTWLNSKKQVKEVEL